MANASSKRIASTNETALQNLQKGLLIVNLLAPAIRFLLSLITTRSLFPHALPFTLYILSTVATVFIYRWFVAIGSPKRSDGQQVRVGDDLGGKGVVEFGWDAIYMTWICVLGSAILGDWFWWFLALIPAFGGYKLFSTIRPLLAMFLPSIFGAKLPRDAAVDQATEQPNEKAESRKQAKLRARMEKGDKRIQQVQRR